MVQNVHAYRVHDAQAIALEDLEAALAEFVFRPVSPREMRRVGWTTPAGKRSTVDAHEITGHRLIAMLRQERLLGPSDYEVQLMQQDRYCESIATWNAEAARGVATERRYGHPDYDGIADTACAPKLSAINGSAIASN